MIVLGIILLVAGFLLKISLLWTIGLILLVVGLVLMDHGTDGTRCRRTQPLLLAGHAKPVHARGSCPANAMGLTPTSRYNPQFGPGAGDRFVHACHASHLTACMCWS